MSDLKEKIKILPCTMCEDMIYCDECGLSKEAEELYSKVREEVIAEISREMRLLYGNEYEKQIRAEVLIKFAEHLLDYDTPLTNEDIIDELCFFIDRNEVENWLKEQK